MQTTTQSVIPIAKPYIGEEEKWELINSVDANWITGGKKVKSFETQIARLQGVKYGVACTNGTSALYMALKALGIGDGDEVIVPDFTFVASANAVTWTGAKPIFVDVREDTMNLDYELIDQYLSRKTKAIMPVHIYGQCCDMVKIQTIAAQHNLYVVEDAAQAVGVSHKEVMAGSFGDINCLSFYADKTLTTGEGGMCLTNNEHYYKTLTALNNQGRQGRGWYIHEQIGYNFRMTDLQAGIGLAQLGKLDYIIEQKKHIEKLYRLLLDGVVSLPKIDDNGRSVPFRVNILVDDPQGLMEYLKEKGVASMRFFYPLHRQPCYPNCADDEYPNSDWLYEHGLSLPSWVGLTDEQVEYIAMCVKAHEIK